MQVYILVVNNVENRGITVENIQGSAWAPSAAEAAGLQ